MKRPATMASQIGFQSLDKSKPNKNKKVKKRSEFTNLLRSCVSKTKSRARNDSETTLPLTFVNKKKEKKKKKTKSVRFFFRSALPTEEDGSFSDFTPNFYDFCSL